MKYGVNNFKIDNWNSHSLSFGSAVIMLRCHTAWPSAGVEKYCSILAQIQHDYFIDKYVEVGKMLGSMINHTEKFCH